MKVKYLKERREYENYLGRGGACWWSFKHDVMVCWKMNGSC